MLVLLCMGLLGSVVDVWRGLSSSGCGVGVWRMLPCLCVVGAGAQSAALTVLCWRRVAIAPAVETFQLVNASS